MITIELSFPDGTECYVDMPACPRVGERVRLSPPNSNTFDGYVVAEVCHDFTIDARRRLERTGVVVFLGVAT